MRKTLLCLFSVAALGGCTSEWDVAKTSNAVARAESRASSTESRIASTGQRAPESRLPDRGDLIVYDRDKPALRRAAFTYHSVGLSEAHALNAAHPGGKVEIQTPSGKTMSFAYQRHVEHNDGNWTWVGRTRDGLDAVITFGPEAVVGRIAQANTESLQLTYANGRTWLVEADPGKLRHPGSRLPLDHDVAVVPKAALDSIKNQRTAAAAAKGAIAANAVAAATGPTDTIDVVLGYTPGLVSQNGGSTSAVVTLLTNRIELTNQALASSQVNPRVRLVHTLQVNYTDTTTNSSTLDALSGQTCTPTSCTSIPVPAELQPLRNARETYGGDIVSLVRPLKEPEHNGCGIAWLLGPNNTTIDNTDAPFAYSVVSNGSDVRESDGFTYSCPVETLAHEMAHNMGQQHNVEDSGGDAGTHSYSYGFRETATNGFYTIMAYPLASSGQFSIPYFGNPNVNYLAGRPTGSANADNARSMNQSMLLVAQFRNTVVPFGGKARNDFNGDGKSEIYWRNSSTGANAIWVLDGATAVSTATVHVEPDQAWKVMGFGDFNADGRSDVFWRNSTTGQNFIHMMNGNTAIGGSFSRPEADMTWNPVAFGDFDGDGDGDIYWRNSITGSCVIWYMQNYLPVIIRFVHTEPSATWVIIGAADFNGDGISDILWRNSTSGFIYMHIMSSTGVNGPASGGVGTVSDLNWKIAAIDDFNGDGKADIYWRNQTTGANYLWALNGLNLVLGQGLNVEPDLNWKIAATGDFNGDGRADVFWRHAGNGSNYVHLMNGAAFLPGSTFSTAQPSQSWQVIATSPFNGG